MDGFNAPKDEVFEHRDGYEVALKAVTCIRQSEQVDVQNVLQLCDAIARKGHWLEPIVVERSQGIVMDGNHRLSAARRLGLTRVPCILLEYGDPRVRVHHWTSGDSFEIAHIYRTIARGELFPYKTTRHRFTPALPTVSVPLSNLLG
ncbi:ParB N-terminal domain-containing protein [Pseudomonas sp. LFM046]|uniref:ParB N-terminal domain-containing protein n=1 Tax=Pseudomonas sp. LFM046 TaxID=1608357 RepID=UPI0005CFD55F|nr:ParB N-terminal domain-containing protein [Pseudomonas sp. LFM046]